MAVTANHQVWQGFFYEKGEDKMEKRLRDLGIEIVRSVQMYERYQYAMKDSLPYTRQMVLANKTFNISFTREVIEDSDIEIHQFIKNLSIQMEYREILDKINDRYNSGTIFPWHKMEGALPKFFTIEEISELLLANPIKEKVLKIRLKDINAKEKMIFQIRFPWQLKQSLDFIVDGISLYGRMAAGILPVNAKLMEE